MPDKPDVRCGECGFLTRLIDREYIEIDEQERRNVTKAWPLPSCLLRQGLTKEIEAVPRIVIKNGAFGESTDLDKSRFTTIINSLRKCDRFRQWDPGLSPVGHREMDIYERQIAREDQRDKDQREWQEKQTKRDEEWRDQDRKATRTNTIIAAAGLAFSGLATAAAIVHEVYADKPQIAPIVVPAPVVNIPAPIVNVTVPPIQSVPPSAIHPSDLPP